MHDAVTGALTGGEALNFGLVLDRGAERHPDRVAVVDGPVRRTYAALRARACAVARLLADRGVQPGDRVAVVLGNSHEFLELFYGTLRAGAVFVPVNHRLALPEVAYILDHADAEVVFASPEWADRLAGDAREALAVPSVAYDAATADERDVPCAPARHDDLQRLMYTSGTTGHPKGVMIHHGAVLWRCLGQIVEFDLTDREVFLASGPLHHVGTLDLPGVGVHVQGGTIVVLPRFEPEAFLRTVERERVTCTFLAPSMINMLLAHPAFGKHDLSSMRVLIDGSEKMPQSLLERMPEAFPNARFFDGFGMTETVTGDTFLDPARLAERLGSVGRPTLGMEVRVVDDDDRDVPAGVPGELVVRGPKLCQGYWRDPDATAEAFRNGWFHTGDVAQADEDGLLFIVDRKKDMIKSGGENIASVEVERVLYAHPDVLETAVVGRRDPRWGEVPVAFVVPREGRALDADRLRAWCDERLARFKVPKEFRQLAELPRTPSGKVVKRELREQVAVTAEVRA